VLTCTEGSSCDMQCDHQLSCGAICNAGTTCILRCGGAQSCDLQCGGTPTDCGNGIKVCNRACPTPSRRPDASRGRENRRRQLAEQRFQLDRPK
jgi:hypothetical protein